MQPRLDDPEDLRVLHEVSLDALVDGPEVPGTVLGHHADELRVWGGEEGGGEKVHQSSVTGMVGEGGDTVQGCQVALAQGILLIVIYSYLLILRC